VRRFFAFFLCIVLLLTLNTQVFASGNDVAKTIYSETHTTNGLTVIDEVIVFDQLERSTDRMAERRKTIYDGDVVIAIIAFTATFHYDGSTVSVIAKSVTQTDTYESWSYK